MLRSSRIDKLLCILAVLSCPIVGAGCASHTTDTSAVGPDGGPLKTTTPEQLAAAKPKKR